MKTDEVISRPRGGRLQFAVELYNIVDEASDGAKRRQRVTENARSGVTGAMTQGTTATAIFLSGSEYFGHSHTLTRRTDACALPFLSV